MGTTSNKITYLNETKNKLKEAINLTNANITNDTFRSYEYKLKKGIINALNNPKAVWDNFEKVESAETAGSITLNPTEFAPIELTLKGNIEQDSTTGKNLLPSTLTSQTLNQVQITKNSDGSVKLNGTNNASTDFKWFEGSLTLPAGTYYIGLGTTSNNFNLYYITGGNAVVIGNPVSNSYYTLTLSQETTITRISSYTSSSKTFSNETYYPMICKELPFNYEPYTNGASPNPDYPQDIHIVSGDNEIKVCNKNLINSLTKVGNIVYFNGYNNQDVYPFKAGTYTLSYKNTNNTTLNLKLKSGTTTGLGQSKVVTFTASEDFNIWFYRSGITIEEFSEVQLEVGSTKTDYVEHKEYTKEINLGELEVGSIGEYEDEFFKNTTDSEYYDSTLELDKWYLKKKIGKVVLDGTQTITHELVNNLDMFKYNNTNMLTGNVLGGYCNYYYNTNGTSTFKDGVIRFGWGNKYLYFMNDTSRFSGTISNFTTWLSTHNTDVYYVLATPENILLNDTLQETLDSFVSYQEQTNISQSNNDLPFVIKARAIKEIAETTD